MLVKVNLSLRKLSINPENQTTPGRLMIRPNLVQDVEGNPTISGMDLELAVVHDSKVQFFSNHSKTWTFVTGKVIMLNMESTEI